MRRRKRALILGCGPAGLFAAHALDDAGWSFDIYSKKRRSEMFGAQYLHEPIPYLSNGAMTLDYKLVGTPEGYIRKVYGPEGLPAGKASVEILRGEYSVWDIRTAYFAAWERYCDNIIDVGEMNASTFGSSLIGRSTEAEVTVEWQRYDLVVTSLPAPSLCYNPGHSFAVQEVWGIGDAPERGVFAPLKVEPMTVVCNGVPDVGWYRAANVFGYNTVEWPHDRKPPIDDVVEIRKPLGTTCDCWTGPFDNWLRVGRYGTWTKGVLAHEAFYQVKERIS